MVIAPKMVVIGVVVQVSQTDTEGDKIHTEKHTNAHTGQIHTQRER